MLKYCKEVIMSTGSITKVEPSDQFLIPNSLREYAESKWLKICVDSHMRGKKNYIKSLEDLYKGITKLSTEDAKSLLFFELKLSGNADKILEYDEDDFRNLLAFQLKDYSNPIERFHLLIENKIKNVLPDVYIGWFKNDLRASLYLAGLIEKKIEKERVVKKGSKEFLIYITDYIRFNASGYLTDAMPNITRMKHDYSKNPMLYGSGNSNVDFMLAFKDLYLNNTTPSKEIKWIDRANNEQIQYLYERLIDLNLLILKKHFFPNNTEEMYYLIVASLDSLSNISGSSGIESGKHKNSSFRYMALYLIEKSWKAVNKRSEASRSSVSSNIKIYEKNRGKLEKLVLEQSTTISKLINKLVIEEYDKTFR